MRQQARHQGSERSLNTMTAQTTTASTDQTKAHKLTPKQEAFARAYIETSNASEAYRQSYSASRMKDETIW